MPDAITLLAWYRDHKDRGDEMRKEVGNAFWTYQHRLAKWIPPEPIEQQKAFDNLKKGIETFPCHKCSEHGLEYINHNPFDAEKETVDQYLCRFHNAVNVHLGKPIVECSIVNTISEVKNCVPKATVDELLSVITDESIKEKLRQIETCEV
jgi:hypothetical protein